MDPTVAPLHRPPFATITTTTHNYLHSIESSPREETSMYSSNHGSSSSSLGSMKLRLMCSSGGHIVPRPHDKTLCYVGGETRMVVVDRHTTLIDLIHRLSKTLLRSSSLSTATSMTMGESLFTLKYQLPSEDLDSLISVTTDEDLENMIEEYERLNSSSSAVSKPSRLRLFLFPTKPESVSSIGSFLENSSKSEDWFLNALNGTNSGFSDTSSVNCLLGLEDDIFPDEKKDVNHKGATTATSLKGNNSGQDVHSIPDSPMMETTSSFGSASSTPSLANLPLIKVNVDDHLKVVGGIEEQFSQMGLHQRHHKLQNDVGFVAAPPPVAVLGSTTAIPEHSDPLISYNERSEPGLQMASLKHQQQFHQKQSTGLDLASSDLISRDHIISDQSSPVIQIQTSSSDPNDTPDQNSRIQMQQQIQNSTYLTQIDAQRPQLHPQQLQFMHTGVTPLQYIHHHPHHPSGAVPVPPYYQMYQFPAAHHQHPHNPAMDQQNVVYYMPHQGYNFPLQPSNDSDAPPNNQISPKVYRRTNSGGAQLVRVSSGHQRQPQYGGGPGGGNYTYEGQHIYYGTQAMPPPPPPPLSAAQYQTMTSTSPAEVRTAQP